MRIPRMCSMKKESVVFVGYAPILFRLQSLRSFPRLMCLWDCSTKTLSRMCLPEMLLMKSETWLVLLFNALIGMFQFECVRMLCDDLFDYHQFLYEAALFCVPRYARHIKQRRMVRFGLGPKFKVHTGQSPSIITHRESLHSFRSGRKHSQHRDVL